MLKIIIGGVIAWIILLAGAQTAAIQAIDLDIDCASVEVIFARGSGQNLEEKEFKRFQEELGRRMEDTELKVNIYELGKDVDNVESYPAVGLVDWWDGAALGAYVSAGTSFTYGDSVSKGRKEFTSYIQQRMQKCKGAHFVVGGYSQGAQIVREAVSLLDASHKNRILYMALFGDPKLYLPEGAGIFPPMCWGGHPSPWRKGVPECRTYVGSLEAQRPYVPTDMEYKTGLWCNRHDFVCGSAWWISDREGHGTYGSMGGAIDDAVELIAARLQLKLPPIEGKKIDVGPKQGKGIVGHDIAFVVDGHVSMEYQLPKIKEHIRKVAEDIKDKNGRIALVLYGYDNPDRDVNGNISPGQPSDIRDVVSIVEFELSHERKMDAVNTFRLIAPDKGSPLEATRVALDGLRWREGAAKSVVLFTNQKSYSDPSHFNETKAGVLKRALEIDPVSIFPVVSSDSEDAYQELADKSSGKVFVDSNEEAVSDDVFTTIINRPVVLFAAQEYAAPAGQQITFDMSSSYALGSTITKYDWDFDGDLTFEETTETPQTQHAYPTNGDRIVQVRATAANGMVANGSAVVKIGPRPEPVLAKAPLNVQVTAVSGQATTATLSWTAADTLATVWAISVNGVKVGVIPGNKTTIDVTDLRRDSDVTFGVTGVTNEGGVGATANAVLTKPTPPAQPCSSGNFFKDLLCRLTAWYRSLIQRLTYHVLLPPRIA